MSEATLSLDDEQEDEDLDIGERSLDHRDNTYEEPQEVQMDEFARDQSQPFIAALRGLKEISNLGKITVSSHKIGNGVKELQTDDLKQFWQ